MLFALAVAAAFVPQAIATQNAVHRSADVATCTLRTEIADGKLVFVGEGGTIKGRVNPICA